MILIHIRANKFEIENMANVQNSIVLSAKRYSFILYLID